MVSMRHVTADYRPWWRSSLLLVVVICFRLVHLTPIESGDLDDESAAYDGLLTAGGWKRNEAGRLVHVPAPGELFDGDIIMSRALRDAVMNSVSSGSKRTALVDDDYLWPHAILPFTIAKGMPSATMESIAKAIAHIHIATCIRLEPRKHETDYIEFDWRKNTCSSSVGRQGGKQIINIGKKCLLFGHAIHEIMHALGFIHEHSRPDRDKYVHIYYDNIKPSQIANFEKYSFAEVDRLDAPYNFDSVMQYPNDAFSANGKPTLLSKKNPFLVFGQRTRFDKGDIDQINRLYKCSGKNRKKNSKLWH